MKKSAIFKQAVSNLARNLPRNLLMLVVVILLSVTVMSLSGLMLGYNDSINENVLAEHNRYGLSATLYAAPDSNSEVLSKKDIEIFINKILEFPELNTLDACIADKTVTVSSNGVSAAHTTTVTENKIYVTPFIVGLDIKNVNISAADNGRIWNENDKGKNHIWLATDKAAEYNKNVGDTLATDKGEFIIIGIDASKTYMEYTHFDITRIQIINESPNLTDAARIADLHNIENLNREMENSVVSAPSDGKGEIYYAIVILVLFLIITTILLSVSALANITKISVDGNNYYFGIMSAIGMQAKQIKTIVALQLCAVVLAGNIIAGFVSWLLYKFAIVNIVEFFINLYFSSATPYISGSLSIFAPIISIVIMTATILLVALAVMKKYGNKNVVDLLREDAE